MKILSLVVIILTAFPGFASPTNTGRRALSLLAAPIKQDEQSKQDLIDRFKATYKSDPRTAYRVATEYLNKYPNDDGQDVQLMKKWVAAYEKVVLGAASADSPSTPSTKSDPKAGGSPSNLEGTYWTIAYGVKPDEVSQKDSEDVFLFLPGGQLQVQDCVSTTAQIQVYKALGQEPPPMTGDKACGPVRTKVKGSWQKTGDVVTVVYDAKVAKFYWEGTLRGNHIIGRFKGSEKKKEKGVPLFLIAYQVEGFSPVSPDWNKSR